MRSEKEIRGHLAEEWSDDYEDALKWVLGDSEPQKPDIVAPIKKFTTDDFPNLTKHERIFVIKINMIIDRLNEIIAAT